MHDPGRVILRRALRLAVVLPLTYVFVLYGLGLAAGAPYAVFGTFALLGFSDFGGPTPDRARAYLLTGVAGLVSITVGTLAASSPYSAVLATFAVGFVLTFSAVLRGYVAAATLSVLLPFVISVTAGPALDVLWQRLAAFSVAVIISTTAALLLWPVHIRSALRLRVAEALSASANALRAVWPDPAASSPVDLETRMRELIEANHHVREQFDGRLVRPGGATARDRALMQLVDEVQRMRFLLRWRAGVPEELRLPADHSLASVTASVLDDCAQAIGHSGQPPDVAILDEARDEHWIVAAAWATKRLREGEAAEVEEALSASFNVRLIALLTELMARHTRIAVGEKQGIGPMRTMGIELPSNDPSPWTIIRSQLTLKSPWFRNSLRAGLALTIAVAVVEIVRISHPDPANLIYGVQAHGFWVVLGTLTALRFDALGTGRTAIQAIAGTFGGFVAGTAALFVIGDNTTVLWILLPILTFLAAYTPGVVSLMVGQGAFTVFVIAFYALVSGPTPRTGEFRLLDVGIGLAISLVISGLMWPRGVMARVRSTLIEAVHEATAYLVVAFDRLVGAPMADEAAEAARHKAGHALARANETFDLAIAQGGAASLYTQTWSAIANAAGQFVGSADLILFLGRNGQSPVGCPGAGDLLLSCARHVQGVMNSAVQGLDKLGGVTPAPEDSPRPEELVHGLMGNPFPRLKEAIASCLQSWRGQTPVPDHSLGEAAISLIWAQDWLIYHHWVAHRIGELVTSEIPAPLPEPAGAKT